MTGKQTLFVRAYLDTLNATAAAERAGYRGDYQTLRKVGSENLTKPHIRDEIVRGLAELRVTGDWIAAKLRRYADLDLGDFAGIIEGEDAEIKEGRLIVSGLSPSEVLKRAKRAGVSHLIRKIKRGANGLEVEYHDPIRALEILARHILPTKMEAEVREPGRPFAHLSDDELRALEKAELEN